MEAPVSIVVGVSRDSRQKGGTEPTAGVQLRILGFNPAVFSQGLKAGRAKLLQTPFCGRFAPSFVLHNGVYEDETSTGRRSESGAPLLSVRY